MKANKINAIRKGFNAVAGIMALVVAGVSVRTAVAEDRPLTVVELYTSQGCSSCPPADAMIGELAKRDDIMPLSLHVDYWNYLGWADKFARPEHTRRQYQYKMQFDSRYVYTPQVVIHGAFVPKELSNDSVATALQRAAKLPRHAVKLTRTPTGVELSLPAAEVSGDIEILSVFYDRRHDTKIKRGENGGRTLAYFNVVRELKRIGVWHGEEKRLSITMVETGGDVCAVILQNVKDRRIVGAARIALDGS